MRKWLSSPLVAALIFGLIPDATFAAAMRGPVDADIVRVVDGDTILVSAMPWPNQRIETYVRLRGIDAPELHSKCLAEKQAGMAAKARLESLLKGHRTIELRNISGGKYFRRVVAEILMPDGHNPAEELLASGNAVRYKGGRKTPYACE